MFAPCSIASNVALAPGRADGTGSTPIPPSSPDVRIYIVPSALGIAFSIMIFAMFLGAMNYANNLALGLAFMLGALGLTAMHHCHRNLAGILIRSNAAEPVFVGQTARFRIAVENTAPLARHEITVANELGFAEPCRVEPNGRAVLEVEVPATRRGQLVLDAFEITTRHPFGLFRAWAYLHMNDRCVVYPRPSERGRKAPRSRPIREALRTQW